MLRFLKFFLILAVIGLLGLAGYAYVGPFFGADFSAPEAEVRIPVTLDAE